MLRWLFPDSAAENKDISIDMRMATLEARILDLEVQNSFTSVTSSKGAPPGMANLRPGYQSRSAKMAKAQGILNARLSKDVPEHA